MPAAQFSSNSVSLKAGLVWGPLNNQIPSSAKYHLTGHHQSTSCSLVLPLRSYSQANQAPLSFPLSLASTIIGALALVLLGSTNITSLKAEEQDAAPNHSSKAGERIEGLPEYSREEVSKHTSKASGGIWVIFQSGVYDITEFIEQHPGGRDKIILAAGGSVEPFWRLYAVHYNAEEPQEIIETLRIGNLREEDVKAIQEELNAEASNQEGPYAQEPKRNPILKIRSKAPFNAETPVALLSDNFLTLNDLFFVRNHLPVPSIDPQSYKLEVVLPSSEGEGERVFYFTLDELKTNFEQKKVVSVVQCAGNRRSEYAKIKPTRGLAWAQGAIGNAEWKGIRLRDLLLSAGLTEQQISEAKLGHILFQGFDNDGSQTFYEASIPIEKGFSESGDVLLAFEMNGETIPLDHGFPVRVIVPGIVGARNVKWLSKIKVSSEESPSFWQREDYKVYSPSIDWNDLVTNSSSSNKQQIPTAKAIQELPVQSAICLPSGEDISLTEGDTLSLKGYAWSGGGRAIDRVEVSFDEGKTWHGTLLQQDEEQKIHYNQSWSWTVWDADIVLDEKVLAGLPKNADGSIDVEIISRAVDSGYNVQPENATQIWNLRGLVNNSWHRVQMKVNPFSPNNNETIN